MSNICYELKMTELILSQRAFIFMLTNAPANRELRMKILSRMTKAQARVIAEIATNALYGCIGLSHKKRMQLRSMKHILRSLSDNRKGDVVRKKIILAYPEEIFLLLQTVFKNLDSLIWRVA